MLRGPAVSVNEGMLPGKPLTPANPCVSPSPSEKENQSSPLADPAGRQRQKWHGLNGVKPIASHIAAWVSVTKEDDGSYLMHTLLTVWRAGIGHACTAAFLVETGRRHPLPSLLQLPEASVLCQSPLLHLQSVWSILRLLSPCSSSLPCTYVCL